METVNVTVRMERQTRDDAAKLFSELGIGTTRAIVPAISSTSS